MSLTGLGVGAMYARGLGGLIRRLWCHEGGNFAMFTAIGIPVLAAAASLAVDTTNLMSMKTRLQNAADASALATSTKLAQGELTAATANAFGTEFFKGMVSGDGAVYDGFNATPSFAFTSTTDAIGRTVWTVAVDVSGVQTLSPMARIAGRDKMTVAIHGKSTSAPPSQSALSMMLVLDKSGSMDWNNKYNYYDKWSGVPKKITALKSAVKSLTDQLIEADPEQKYVRLGAVSYHEDYYKDGIHKIKPIDWDPAATKTFVDTLTAEGGTDSSGAMLHAYNTLKFTNWQDVEGKAHKDKNGLEPKRFILLMTDGQNSNTYGNYDADTKAACVAAKNKGIIIYSVAFMAPVVGQNLLKYCATDASHYFDANDNEQLVKAFKTIGLKAANMMVRLTE